MSTFKDAVDLVLLHEGGYVHDPKDKGGETNYGISKRAFPNEDIKALTRDRAKELYREHYWIPAHCEQLPPHLRALHMDSAVNCGVKRAIQFLQRAAGVKDDGVFGPETAKAAPHVRLAKYALQRITHYERIIAKEPTQARFRKGWIRRVQYYTNND